MSLSLRLAGLLTLLLLLQGAALVLLGAGFAAAREAETQQRLSRGLAAHIVGQWPELGPELRTGLRTEAAPGSRLEAVPNSPVGEAGTDRAALLRMLATVNPAVQVYLLDAAGRVAHYIGEPGMVRNEQVDLEAVRAFIAGAPLPLTGTDPMDAPGAGRTRLFSAAMFPTQPGATRPAGYLYVVLDSPARARLVAAASSHRVWLAAAAVIVASLAVLLVLGIVALRRMTRPLARLAQRMQHFNLPGDDHAASPAATTGGDRPALPAFAGDEVQQIGASFETMAERLAVQAAQATQSAQAHRQEIAGLAHDLRTPLTALHGHLEALAAGSEEPDRRRRLVSAAVQHSEKVRRLAQQLLELATLRAAAVPPARERFRLDELVSDTVQKFELGHASVVLAGPAPGPLEVEGDLQLIDRALTNMIDNAVRHAAPGGSAQVQAQVRVQVELACSAAQVQVVVQDRGPGLPAELAQRLTSGAPVHEAARAWCERRAPGGIGGLGLAITQRIAELHGGRLEPLPSPGGGTRLALSLPRV